MKRFILVIGLLLLVAAGCGSDSVSLEVQNDPYYKEGEPTEIVLEAVDDSGEAVTGLAITGELEMEKMDHGTITVSFDDNGDGTYAGEVLLPMGGEWIMSATVEKDGKEKEQIVRFQVSEG